MRLPRVRFALRRLMVVVAALGLNVRVLPWPACAVVGADQERAIADLREAGATVERDSDRPGRPAVRAEFATNGVPELSEDDLKNLQSLTTLRELDLTSTNVSDADLAYFRDLTDLRVLD